eukprot:gene12382-biopygen409
MDSVEPANAKSGYRGGSVRTHGVQFFFHRIAVPSYPDVRPPPAFEPGDGSRRRMVGADRPAPHLTTQGPPRWMGRSHLESTGGGQASRNRACTK